MRDACDIGIAQAAIIAAAGVAPPQESALRIALARCRLVELRHLAVGSGERGVGADRLFGCGRGPGAVEARLCALSRRHFVEDRWLGAVAIGPIIGPNIGFAIELAIGLAIEPGRAFTRAIAFLALERVFLLQRLLFLLAVIGQVFDHVAGRKRQAGCCERCKK